MSSASKTPLKRPAAPPREQTQTSQSPAVNKISYDTQIMDVWSKNLDEEISKISDLLEQYPYIAMDTEFPGFFGRNEGQTQDSGYKFIKTNVDQLKLIQVGITLADEDGNMPSPVNTWQFNLKFDLKKETHHLDSINMLKDAGIKFEYLADHGIEPLRLAEALISSGLVLNEDIVWVTFHGSFDFAYMLRLLIN